MVLQRCGGTVPGPARPDSQGRLAHQPGGDAVNRVEDRQSEVDADVLGEQVRAAAGNGADLGDGCGVTEGLCAGQGRVAAGRSGAAVVKMPSLA
jgi:hypothetical protein